MEDATISNHEWARALAHGLRACYAGAMRVFAKALFGALAALALAHGAAAEPVRTDNVEAELHSARAAVAPGETFTVVFRQNIRQGWHTYWRNPGDSGEPTEIVWRAPAGVTAGPLQYPAPERIPFDILVNYGYSNEVLFPVEVTAPANARPGDTLTLPAHATWLVCSDICIPEEAALTLTVPVAAQGADDPTWGPRIARAVAELPRAAEIEGRVTAITGGARFTFAGEALAGGSARVRDPHFFPYRGDAIEHAAPENASLGPAGVALMAKPGAAQDLGETELEGVLTVEERADGAWVRRAYEVRATPGPALPGAGGEAAAQGGAASDVTLPLALLLAFAGGLLLNIMPCLFPVLSIMALSLASHGGDVREARRSGLFFLAGVMATFLALAGVLVALKAGGEAIGWGFQLQSPVIVAALALLFFAIGLNLLGAFEIGGSLQNVGGGLASQRGAAGAFFTGALAVIAATPCTAPFMASATGYAATQGAATTLLVFAALGFGFALPFTALSFLPQLQKLLPKPGDWMTRAKIVLAFPMFAAAVWLAWVLTAQAGANGLLVLLAAATALGFFVTVGRWGVGWRIAGALVVLAVAVIGWRPLAAPAQATTTAAEIEATAWSPTRVTELVNQGHGVFVNFTAAWCVTCQVNKITALNSTRIARAFEDNDIVYLEADWTNRDEQIASALAEHGRDGVPLYLYYAPGSAQPVVLPQVLTESIVLDFVEEDGAVAEEGE